MEKKTIWSESNEKICKKEKKIIWKANAGNFFSCPIQNETQSHGGSPLI